MKAKIKIDDKDVEIRIQFVHKQFSHNEKMDKSPLEYHPFNGITECYLTKENNVILSVGHSHCTINDTFCKETGRKIALTRAVCILPKEERKKIWMAYLNRKLKVSNYKTIAL